MKKKRRKLSLLLLLLSIFSLSACSFFKKNDLIKPTNDFYVHDEAGYLDSATKEEILAKNHDYEGTQEQPQIVVVFIDNQKDDIDVDRYTNDLAESWGVGNKDKDNGVMILFARNGGENNARIEVGYGLEEAITDSQSSDILNANKSFIKSTDRKANATGIFTVFKEVSLLVDKEYGYTSTYVSNVRTTQSAFPYGLAIGVCSFIVLLFLIIYRWVKNNPDIGSGSGSSGNSRDKKSGRSHTNSRSGGSRGGGGSFGGGGSSI